MRYSDETIVVIKKVLHKKLKQRALDEDKTLKTVINDILEGALVGDSA